jgi:hypothetical protein
LEHGTWHPKNASRGATPSGDPGGVQMPADLAELLRRLDADLAALYGERYGLKYRMLLCSRGVAALRGAPLL